MGFLFALAKFVKLALLISIILIFLRAILFPNALDILVLMMLLFVLFILLVIRP